MFETTARFGPRFDSRFFGPTRYYFGAFERERLRERGGEDGGERGEPGGVPRAEAREARLARGVPEVVPEVARREPRVRRVRRRRGRLRRRDPRAERGGARGDAQRGVPAPSATALAALRNAAGDARRIAAGAARTSPAGANADWIASSAGPSRVAASNRVAAHATDTASAIDAAPQEVRTPGPAWFGTHCVRADAPLDAFDAFDGFPGARRFSASTKTAALGPFAATRASSRKKSSRGSSR